MFRTIDQMNHSRLLQILLKNKIVKMVLLSWMMPELFGLGDAIQNTFPFLPLFHLFMQYFAV